jgi:hypothetical protein
MDTTTTNSFTKELFDSLRLDWDSHAKARDMLSDIIFQEETLDSIMEDVVFSLSYFLDYVRDLRNIPKTEKRIAPFFVIVDNNYCLHIGDDDDSKVVFVIVDTEDAYLFQRAMECRSIDHTLCASLDELKFYLLLWFNEFYQKFEDEEG